MAKKRTHFELDATDLELAVDPAMDSVQTRTLVACRLVTASILNPNTGMTHEEIAKASNLPTWMVRKILQSPEYADLIRTEVKSYLPTLLMKTLAKIETKITGEDDAPFSNSQLINALNAVTRATQSFHQYVDSKNEFDAEASMRQLGERMDALASERSSIVERAAMLPEHGQHQEEAGDCVG